MMHSADVRNAAKTYMGRCRRGVEFWGEDRRYKGLDGPRLLRVSWSDELSWEETDSAMGLGRSERRRKTDKGLGRV